MKVELNRKLSKSKQFIFTLCDLKVQNLTMMFLGLVVAQQLISAAIEFAVWGEAFPHIIDSVFFFSVSWTYLYYLYGLGDFLLDMVLNGEVKEDE